MINLRKKSIINLPSSIFLAIFIFTFWVISLKFYKFDISIIFFSLLLIILFFRIYIKLSFFVLVIFLKRVDKELSTKV